MKKITVSDILNLDIMKSGRLVAGENGLSNEIRYVSVYDNIPTELDAKIQVFEGDIYLTFCSYGKGNEEYVLNLVKMIISFGAAALIIFDENIQALPPSAEKIVRRNRSASHFYGLSDSLLFDHLQHHRIPAGC